MKVQFGDRHACVATISILATLSITQSACNSATEVMINRAYAISGESRTFYSVHAIISTQDINEIVDNEIYSHLVVFDCRRGELRYPIEPNIGDVPLSSFARAREHLDNSNSNLIEIEGNVSREVMSRFDNPCVRLDGGSYLGRELNSNIVPLQLP